MKPVTVAARRKELDVFARSNRGFVVRIPLKAWLYVCNYSVFLVLRR
jgi:hypothetical protein